MAATAASTGCFPRFVPPHGTGMVPLAISDWQLALYSAPAVVGIVLLVLALLRWSEGPRDAQPNQRQPAKYSSQPANSGLASPTPPSTPGARSRHHNDQVVACPECSIRITAGQLNLHRHQVHGTVRRCPLCNQYIRADGLLRHNLKKHGVRSQEPLKRPSLQCPRCHNVVLRANIYRHLNQVHGVNFRPAVGWHPIVAGMRHDTRQFWLIDGLNIVRLQGEDVPRFDFLLALTYHMLQDDIDFLCVFDASARPCVKELQGTYFAEVCEQLIRVSPQRFSEVPAGNTADEAILDIATMLGQSIITNDQFRDHAPSYPWLETNRDGRFSNVTLRHSARPHRELLVWQDMTIAVPAPQKIRSFVQEYRQLLSERDKQDSTASA